MTNIILILIQDDNITLLHIFNINKNLIYPQIHNTQNRVKIVEKVNYVFRHVF